MERAVRAAHRTIGEAAIVFSRVFMFGFFRLLLVVFFVIPLIRSVIQTVVRAFRGTEVPPVRKTGQPPPASASASTLLHRDPVCGTYVAAASSLRRISHGKVFHFCSEACRDRFAG
jgi:YHS domain-containing protein